MNPLTMALQKQVPLPTIPAPSLDGLRITAPRPRSITADDVKARLEELRFEHAAVTEHPKGHQLTPRDQVRVNILGYVGGKLVPRSSQFGVWLRLDQPLNLEALGDALRSAKVGDGVKVNLTLPETFFVPELRGKPAVYVVDVLEARSLVLPEVESPEFLRKLNANSVPEALTNIANELVARELMTTTYKALALALDAAAERANVKLTTQVVQQELWNLWRETEGKALSEHGLVGEDQTDSFESFRADPAIVDDVTRRIRNTVVLAAVCDAHPEALTEERMAETAQRWATAGAVPPDVLREELNNAGTRKKLGGVIAQLAAAEFILERTTVTYSP